MAILLGAQAPNFSLSGWNDSRENRFTLLEQRGHPLVLAFYPGDQRLVCTRQMCSYSDNLPDLQRFDTVVWGISPQSVASHQKFAEGRRLQMPLLADIDKKVARDYGVVGAFGLRRSVFVVDSQGAVSWRWVSTTNVTFPGVDEISKAVGHATSPA